MKKVVVVVAIIFLMTGCAVVPSTKSSDAGPYPSNYYMLVKNWMGGALFDPYSVRDLEITLPTKGALWHGLLSGGSLPAWTICVSLNAKNRLGAYTGWSTIVLFIRNNIVVEFENYGSVTMSTYQCGRVTVTP